MSYQCKQVQTQQTKILGIMASKAFRLGVEDVRNGNPFRDFTDVNNAWAYERGRLFACVYRGPVKHDRRVTYEALVAMGRAVDSRDII